MSWMDGGAMPGRSRVSCTPRIWWPGRGPTRCRRRKGMRPQPGQQQQQRRPHAEGFKRGAIRDVVIYDLRKFVDERGWLAELFRLDELAEEFYPQMTYISSTLPGVTRGPHEHVHQADLFCFIGPSNFKIRMWDNRADSETYGFVM